MREIVNSIGSDPPKGRVQKVVDIHGKGFTLRTPLDAVIFELVHEILFLRIDRNHGLTCLLIALHFRLNIGTLQITIMMRGTPLSFTIGLQAVSQLMQQIGHFLWTKMKPKDLQLTREDTHTLTGPLQGRFGIASSGRLH